MAETEERPSKIRKIESSKDVEESLDDKGPGNNVIDQDHLMPDQTKDHSPQEEDLGNKENDEDEHPEAEATTQAIPEELPLSKSALKRLRKAEQWAARKEYRKLKKKEKAKEKKARKAEQRAIEASAENPNSTQTIVKKVQERKPRPVYVPISLILDCSFDDLMMEKEIISLGSQVMRSYSENRKASVKAHLAVSFWGGRLKHRFEGVMGSTHHGWKGVKFLEGNWVEAAGVMDGVMRSKEGGVVVRALAGVEAAGLKDEAEVEKVSDEKEKNASEENREETREEKSFDEKEEPSPEANFLTTQPQPTPENSSEAPNLTSASKPSPPTQIIYLTSESPNTLTTLSPYTSYIIGGLVDKNRHKGICYKRACEHTFSSPNSSLEEGNKVNITTAKLPIGQYMTMQSRQVLAVNHVVEIMIKYLGNGEDWGKAFLSVIPGRKGARLKGRQEGGEEGERGEEDEEDDGGVEDRLEGQGGKTREEVELLEREGGMLEGLEKVDEGEEEVL